MSSDHESPIKTPKQLATVVGLAFIVPIILIMLLVAWVNTEKRTGAGSQGASAKAVSERIKPVASYELKDVNAPKVLKTGEQVYTAQCSACHKEGAAGAPKYSDAAAWAPRIKTGFDALWNSALKGKGAMSAQGGGELDDIEIARAVVYMSNAGGAKFAEPAVAAPAAAATAPAAK
jgi:cytochrome c5